MDELLVFKETYEIRAGEIDRHKQITIPALMQLMQEASLKHIILLKASVWDLVDSSWILLTKEIHINRLPMLGEQVTIETYPAGVDKIFAYRDYRVFDEEGNCIVYAPSTWTLMNLVERKLERIPDRIRELEFPGDKTRLEICNRRLRMPQGDVKPHHISVGYFDQDWNNHVNNVNYLKYILESDVGRLKSSSPLHIEIHFKGEAVEGDDLEVYNYDGGNPEETFHKIIKRGEEKEITLARIVWGGKVEGLKG